MTTSDAKMKRILDFDALHEAEKLTGEDYHDDKHTEHIGVGMFLANSAIKQTELRKRNDTSWGMDYQEYLSIVLDMGFEIIKAWNIPKEDRDDEVVYFLWNEEHGVPLIFDTYKGCVNEAHINANWRPNPELEPHELYEFTSTGCMSHKEEGLWCGQWDAREAFRFRFNNLIKNGTFISPWVDMDFPSFRIIRSQDWPKDGDWEEKKRKVKEISLRRFKELPEHIQQCLAVAFEE